MKKINWSISGLASEQEAVDRLDMMQDWFRKTHRFNDWTVVASANKGPYGWRAELEGIEAVEET